MTKRFAVVTSMAGRRCEARPADRGSDPRRRKAGFAVAVLALVGVLGLATSGFAAGAAKTTRASVSSAGAQGKGNSGSAAISADGSTVAFASDATNLVPDDSNHKADVFVRALDTSTTKRVSVSSTGAQANGDSMSTTDDLIAGPSISADGRFVAFGSIASNLVAHDTNGKEDVFVRDLKLGTTTRVSVGTAGAQGNNASFQPSVSADGRYVAFASAASNLVPGDSNRSVDIFVRDLRAQTTRRVSLRSGGGQDNGADLRPSISADGRLVVFESLASNLVAGDSNRTFDVFARDLATGTTRRVSVSSAGTGANGGSFTGRQPSISANRRYVAFYSLASNLAPGDSNRSYDVFVRDLTNHTTKRVSVGSGGAQGNNDSFLPSISADGKIVGFESTASNLTAGDSNHADDGFIRNLATAKTQRVSVSSGGAQARGPSEWLSISADGRFVAFDSAARNLVGGDINRSEDVFVRGPLP